MKNADQPHTPTWVVNLDAAQCAPRCHARRKSDGKQCQGPAVNGRAVCRLHGGKGGAPAGKRNGAYKSGRFAQEAIAERQKARAHLREFRALLAQIPAVERVAEFMVKYARRT